MLSALAGHPVLLAASVEASAREAYAALIAAAPLAASEWMPMDSAQAAKVATAFLEHRGFDKIDRDRYHERLGLLVDCLTEPQLTEGASHAR
jgi:hypothetical protein